MRRSARPSWLRSGALVSLLLLACGRTAAPFRPPERPAPATPPPTTSSPVVVDEGAPGDLLADLRELSERWGTVRARIVYGFESGPPASPTRGTLVFANRPPAAWRLDVDTEGARAVAIRRGVTRYTCTGGPDHGSCFRSEHPERFPAAVPAPFSDLFTDPSTLARDVERRAAGATLDRRSDIIAGEQAVCFRAAAAGGEGGEWCFTPDGLLVRASGPGDGPAAFRLEATSVGREVSGEDFDPPYQAVEIRP